MKILARYILKEFLVPLVYCLTGFVSIYVLFELFGSFSRLMEAHLPFRQVLVYFAGYLAPYFHYLAPAALMLATLYTMWQMCHHSEIVAMRASGVSFLAIARPLLFAAAVVALFVVFVNEWFVPRYAHWAAQMKTERFNLAKVDAADDIIYRNADEGRTWVVGRLIDPNGSSLGDVRITFDRPGGACAATVTAERADYLDGEWWLSGTEVRHHDAAGLDVASLTPELDALSLRCFDDFGERPSDFIMQNRPWKFNSVRDRFRYIRTHPELSDERRGELLYDTWAQIMAPFACLIITLFAIPAGIASGRQSVFKSVLGALGLFFAFYAVTILLMIVTKNGWCPPVLGAVLPPVAFLAVGVRAFLRQA